MKTVYIAGKITGDPNYRHKFRAAALELEVAGFAVVNPATLPPNGFEYPAYIRISTAMLDECVAVCFLSDWRDSPGALHEFERAKLCGKEIFYFEEWQKVHSVISSEKTGKLAFRCLICKEISVYNDRTCDGRTCAHCGGHIVPLGYAKRAVKVNA